MKDKRDWSDSIGSGSAVRGADIASLSQDKGMSLSVDKAQSRIGRPLTPGSVAGVHRRVREAFVSPWILWPRI